MSCENKDKYGEVFTPESLVSMMIEDAKKVMGNHFFKKRQTIFETGAGKGIFYDTLNHCGDLSFYHSYVMNEINPSYKDVLEHIIPQQRKGKDKVYIQDLFSFNDLNSLHDLGSFDLIWGNLPFQSGGKAFVPSLAKNNGGNSNVTKPKGRVTIWPKMIHHLFTHFLKEGGYFFCIIPCIWLKQDRANIYDLFVKQHHICFLKVFNCYEANKLFGYNCQTPMCYVMVQKKGICSDSHVNKFKLYDKDIEDYIDFTLLPDYCIPSAHASMFQKQVSLIQTKDSYVSCYNKIKKISLLKQEIVEKAEIFFTQKSALDTGYLEDFSFALNESCLYKVITGASIDKKKDKLVLHGFVSKMHGLYYGIPKLILPHKRLLRFFKDVSGTYSCYGRDMYVFLCPNGIEQMNTLEKNLTSNLIMIEEGFRIRMNFIEKYVFQYVEYKI